jgi:hypothetical protein
MIEEASYCRRTRNQRALLRKVMRAALVLVLVLACLRGARTGDVRDSGLPFSNSHASSVPVPALGLAVADFTGDSHPDLATVKLNGLDSPRAQYLIEVRLSEGGSQSLRLVGPFGGLLITPRDLTGDGNVDLVVRSARSHWPVAVFLNDGHGHFSPAAPSLFAQGLRDIPDTLQSATEQTYPRATLVPPESYTLACEKTSIRDPKLQDGVLSFANVGAPIHLFLPFGSNRAPPAVA